MPRRTDLQRIMVIGSGPIVIGQACEFDYSGTQACKVLRARGLRGRARELEPRHDHDRPASSPTGPTSSRSRPRRCWRSSSARSPDALLPTLGGQTGLNVARRARGVGRPRAARRRADRRLARGDPQGRGPQRVQGGDARRPGSTCRARASRTRSTRRSRWATSIGFPLIVRASFTLGGGGSGFADDRPELATLAARGARRLSPVTEILVEESIAGWKEFELEVMRDARRQRRRRLLDRERRPDGRAHRRLDHGRPAADPHRPRVPADARHGARRCCA